MIQMKPTCGHVVTIPKSKQLENEVLYTQLENRGVWFRKQYEGEDVWFIHVNCPDCGASLCVKSSATGYRWHDIAPDGTVSPSVGCGHCGWHEFIKLEGWSP